MLKIIQAPNKVLSEKAKTIGKIDKEILTLTKEMEESLIIAKDPEGVGLAAPQVGKSLQLFLVKQTPRSPTLIFINPKIESFIDNIRENPLSISDNPEKEKGVQLEGCLSLYNIWGVVKRHPGVIVSFIDEKGEKHKKKFEGFLATIIQHEYDHLQGILFPKRVLEQNNKLYKSSRDEKGESVFDEIEL